MDKIKRIQEIKQLIAELQTELFQLNPYAELPYMSNKMFGEGWSEPYVLSKCDGLKKDNSAGHDFYSNKLGKVELKSSRLPNKGITYNQCHPYECDCFLFINYNTDDGTEEIYLVPSKDIVDSSLFSLSVQHSRTEGCCYSLNMKTQKNQKSLANYHIPNFETLNKIAKEGFDE